jgi:hypothetical protein
MTHLKAIIIKGNSKYVDNNPAAEQFYNDIRLYLEAKGYEVVITDSKTTPPKAHLLIGHSMGINGLHHIINGRRRSNKNANDFNGENGVKLLALGVLPEKVKDKSIIVVNHPDDEKYLRECLKGCKYDKPIDEHYIFTDAMKEAIDKMTDEWNS